MNNRLLLVAIMLGVLTTLSQALAIDKLNRADCTLNGHRLYGKIKIVDSFADLKVKIVDFFTKKPG